MRRIKKLAGLTLDRSLYYTNEYMPQKVSAESKRTIDGGVIVWEQENKDITNDIIIESLDNYPITEDELKLFQYIIDNSLGRSYEIIFTDGSIMHGRFKHEDEALISEAIYEGACYYTVTIKMARI